MSVSVSLSVSVRGCVCPCPCASASAPACACVCVCVLVCLCVGLFVCVLVCFFCLIACLLACLFVCFCVCVWYICRVRGTCVCVSVPAPHAYILFERRNMFLAIIKAIKVHMLQVACLGQRSQKRHHLYIHLWMSVWDVIDPNTARLYIFPVLEFGNQRFPPLTIRVGWHATASALAHPPLQDRPPRFDHFVVNPFSLMISSCSWLTSSCGRSRSVKAR